MSGVADMRRSLVFTLPRELRIIIDRYILENKFSADRIIAMVKQHYPKYAELMPSTGTLFKYVKWRRQNPKLSAVYLPPELNEDEQQELNNSPVSGIVPIEDPITDDDTEDVNSSKDIMESMKGILWSRIKSLKGELSKNFDYTKEKQLSSYLAEMRQLVQADVKLAEDLKDSDKISISEIKLSLTRLFSAVYMAVDRVMPEKKEEFRTQLFNVLKYYKSNILLNEENNEQESEVKQ